MKALVEIYPGPVHLIGIGGIGMSAIAKILKSKGFIVQGSDLSFGSTASEKKLPGIKTFANHQESNIGEAKLVIKSSAIKDGNPEVVAARKRGINLISRADALSMTLDEARVVSVTGTHGKTTTTGLLGMLCIQGELDPTVVNGGVICQLESNIKIGRNDFAIVESDESDGSFLTIPSDLGIVTNMDFEHLDYYGSEEKMISAYRQFLNKTKERCLVCYDHEGLKKLSKSLNSEKLISYAVNCEADIGGSDIEYSANGMSFNVKFSKRFIEVVGLKIDHIKGIELSLYGNHNVTNALAVLGTGLLLGIKEEDIKKSFENFRGIKRRFEKIGEVNSTLLIDDYAHHPEEIKATLKSAKNLAIKRGGGIIAIMQPHKYTRLRDLMTEFGHAFDDVDHVLLAPVYSAGEGAMSGVNHDVLAEKIRQNGKKVTTFYNEKELFLMINSIINEKDVIILLGAGNITNWSADILNELSNAHLANNVL